MTGETGDERAKSVGDVALARAAVLARTGLPRLLVFLHSAVKQRAFQAELQQPLQGVEVTAVGRISDFDRAREGGQDAVLTLPVVLEARGLTPKLRGERDGKFDEPYSLVGVGAPPDASGAAPVGALDILGREGTATFVHMLVGAKPNVERVTKVEDLLALLQLQRVGSILLPTRLISELRAVSRLALVERALSTRVGLPAVAGEGPESAKIIAAIAKLGSRLARATGVEAWR